MGLFDFLIVVQGIVAASLVGIILMQRSEGGGLGTGGGSPSGLMSARGAADFMTRTTAVLAVMFVLLSVALAFVAAQRTGGTVDESFSRTEAVAPAEDAAEQGAGDAEADAPPPVEDAIPLDQ